jgi:cyanophycinase-like exopeptidase
MSTGRAVGPIALVGSGEFLPGMREVDAELLAGRAQRAVFLPTAAALEGDQRIDYWIGLGTAHYRAMGVEPLPLRVLSREDADNPELAGQVEGAGLVYLSGGNPGYLVQTLRDTLVWRAIHAAWEAGAALAGCSAGAIALSAVVPDPRSTEIGRIEPALGVAPQLAVIPHFDRFDRVLPRLAARIRSEVPPGVLTIGIDEDTALVGGPEEWTVRGRQRVWVIGDDDDAREGLRAGARLNAPLPPDRG